MISPSLLPSGKSSLPSLSLGQIGLFNLCLAVLVMGPSLFFLYDGKVSPTHSQTRPLKEELRDIWRMVTRQSLLWPMLFVAVGTEGEIRALLPPSLPPSLPALVPSLLSKNSSEMYGGW